MKHIKVPELSEADRFKFEKDYHNSPVSKSSGKSVSEIAEIFDVTIPAVYTWIKRYKENNIKDLKTRHDQGRKPIMNCSDEEAVRKAIDEDRQSVSKAREA